ncbi:MAG: cysteine-rich CWC family protein [Parafilimonas sp.]
MPVHETKICVRCNNAFECKAGDITNCQCNNIELSIEERSFIEDGYSDCVCINCLLQLKNRYVLFKEKYLFNA